MGRQRFVPARAAGLIVLLLLLVGGTTSIGGERIMRAIVPFPVGDECGERRPTVVDLHGYSETVVQHENVTGWHTFAEEHDFLLITPHADGRPASWDLEGDVATIERTIDNAIDTSCADPARVYVTGYSQGGFLVTHLVCRLADRIAAVAPVAGMRFVRPCEWSRPMPLLAVHGANDDTVLFDGGLNAAAADALGLPEEGPSIPAIVQLWADRNGCDDEGLVEPSDRVTIYRYPCPAGADVELHVINEGSHGYPTSANERIWSFFQRHSLTR